MVTRLSRLPGSFIIVSFHPVVNPEEADPPLPLIVIPSEGRRSEPTKHESRDLVFHWLLVIQSP